MWNWNSFAKPFASLSLVGALLSALAAAQEVDPRLYDPSDAVRLAAVEAIIQAGGSRAPEQLRVSCKDGSGDIQRLAVAGIVNFYLPGYVKTGVKARFTKIGDKIVRNNTEWLLDPWITVREEDGDAILGVLRDPKSDTAKLEAAQALGILRYKKALPDLYPLLKSKNDGLMMAALRAVETAGDKSAAQETVFLARDLNEKIHLRVMSIQGVFRNENALPDLAEVFTRSRNAKSRAGAMEAIAMIASPDSKGLFEQNLNHKETGVRAAAAEGLGRLGSSDRKGDMEKLFEEEGSMRPRLGQAFALVKFGDRSETETSPLSYLFNTLNSIAWKDVASAYLEELGRDENIRIALRGKIVEATSAEKQGLAAILGKVGGRDDKATLDALANDKDPKVAQEGLKAAKALNARLP